MSNLGKTCFKCTVCDRTFSTSSNLSRHRTNVHSLSANSDNFGCVLCGENQLSNNVYITHLKDEHDCSVKNEEGEFESFEGKFLYSLSLESRLE